MFLPISHGFHVVPALGHVEVEPNSWFDLFGDVCEGCEGLCLNWLEQGVSLSSHTDHTIAHKVSSVFVLHHEGQAAGGMHDLAKEPKKRVTAARGQDFPGS